MKVTKKEQQPEFKPVTIEITFETLREYQLFKQWVGNTSRMDLVNIANKSGGEIKDFNTTKDADLSTVIYNAL